MCGVYKGVRGILRAEEKNDTVHTGVERGRCLNWKNVGRVWKGLLTHSYVWVLVAQSCLTLYDSMVYSPPDSSVHGILQARILEWVAIPFSRGSYWPRNQTQVSRIAGGFFTIWATRKPLERPCSLHISETAEGFQVGERHDEIYLFFIFLAAQSSM